MALDTTSSDDAAGFTEPADVAADKLQPRGFQYEMLEESLKRNTIVAVCSTFGSSLQSDSVQMDTGSGKTLM